VVGHPAGVHGRDVVGTSSCEIGDLFVAFARHRDRRLLDALVDAHAHLATACAHRFAGRGEDLEDLQQVALIALVHAIDRFDPARGVRFASYAVPTMTGALKRHLRDHGWVVRPPRRRQERYLHVAKLVSELSGELGRTPEIADLAGRGSWTEAEVRDALGLAELRRPRAPSIDDADVKIEPFAADTGLARVEQRRVISTLTDQLSEFERRVVRMRFVEDMTQSAIASRIGMSQMHVSRVLSRVLERLRTVADEQIAAV
jgi:RNA polymerase sigma-B factor